MVMEAAYWWVQFVFAWWILFPAYAANVFPPLARGKVPIDTGKKWFDGRRLFGDHKTVEGFGFGVLGGTLVGLIEIFFQPQLNAYAAQWGMVLPQMTAMAAFSIVVGAMLGDLGGSFIKRRLNMKPGTKAPLLDQLNFIVGAVLVSMWFIQITPLMFVFMLLLTPATHRLVNIIGYKLNAKKVPW